jgi:acylphosphatase
MTDKIYLTRRLAIFGRVQGVGYRWSLSAEARALGLSGWVRNRSDGSVEALICGTPSARVERVISNDEPNSENQEKLAGFKQRPTF